MDNLSRKFIRRELEAFVPSHSTIVKLENMQDDVVTTSSILAAAPFILTSADDNLGAARILTGSANISLVDAGAGGNITLNLTNTTVTPGTYGSATRLASYTVDQKGRLTSGTDYELNSDNVTEGGTNLFFTVERARASLSGVGGISYDPLTGVIDTQGFTGTAGPVNFNKGIAATGTAVTGFTGSIPIPCTSIAVTDGLITGYTP